MYSNDIVEGTLNIIEKRYGTNTGLVFIDLQRSILGGSVLYLEELPPNIQIKEMNNFWRRVLNKYPNSTNIKAWLCESNDINIYLNAFENHWLPMLVNNGILQ